MCCINQLVIETKHFHSCWYFSSGQRVCSGGYFIWVVVGTDHCQPLWAHPWLCIWYVFVLCVHIYMLPLSNTHWSYAYSNNCMYIVSYCWCFVITVGLGWFGILVCRNTSHLLCMVSVAIYTYIISDALMSCFGITLACEHYPVWHKTSAVENFTRLDN